VDQWCHVAAVSDGRIMSLWVNGERMVEHSIERNRGARVSGPAWFRLGHTGGSDLSMLNGSLDDVRLWRRALAPEEVASLASPEPPPRLLLTRGVYSAGSDLAADVVGEFGLEARVADWRDLERWHRDDILGWSDDIGLSVGNAEGLLTSDGQRLSSGNRHYFLNRFDGRRPEYFKAHAELGGMQLALGSWHGVTTRVLARLPSATARTTPLRPGAAGVIEHAIAGSAIPCAALALEWDQEIRLRGDPVEATFRLRDGRTVVATCGGVGDGLLGISFGSRERPERTRQLTATYGTLRFALAVRDGSIAFRAVAALGTALVFDERLPLELRVEDVVAVTLRGVDSGELTLEQ
jgi:hypothetical protein